MMVLYLLILPLCLYFIIIIAYYIKYNYFTNYGSSGIGSKYKNVITLFFPGNGSSKDQMIRYTNNLLYTKATTPVYTNLLINPIAVQPYDVVDNSILVWFVYPIYYILNVIVNKFYNITPYFTNPFKINLCQDGDLKSALEAVKFILDFTDKDIILYGCSRGSVVALSVATLLNQEEQKRIKLIVAEGCFTSIEDVIDTKSNIRAKITRFLLKLTEYNSTKKTPLEYIKDLNPNIPVVVVSSIIDEVVANKLSKKVYSNLPSVKKWYIELYKSSHPKYASAEESDRHRYYTELHNIYDLIL